MSEYDLDWFRGVVKYVCGISFLVVAACVFTEVFSYEFSSPILDTILGTFLLYGVVSGLLLVIVDLVLMIRGNADD